MLNKLRNALALTFSLLATAVAAQPSPLTSVEIPKPNVTEIALPGGKGPNHESWSSDKGETNVRNVTYPTLTPVMPKTKPTGAAMIVAPGGAFLGLAIEKEGWAIAEWLAEQGITAFVLKYRLLPTPLEHEQFVNELAEMLNGKKVSFAPPGNTPDEALTDGLNALRYVRAHAEEYGIDPNRVGFMGFSAGGFLSRSVVEKGGEDAPNFVAPIYPSMKPMNVPDNAPPMFVAIAADDFLVPPADQGFPLISSYRNAGKPIEFHLLASGGHGFGKGTPGTPSEHWLSNFRSWLTHVGALPPRNP